MGVAVPVIVAVGSAVSSGTAVSVTVVVPVRALLALLVGTSSSWLVAVGALVEVGTLVSAIGVGVPVMTAVEGTATAKAPVGLRSTLTRSGSNAMPVGGGGISKAHGSSIETATVIASVSNRADQLSVQMLKVRPLVAEAAAQIATLLGTSIEAVAASTTANAARLFGLPVPAAAGG